jgi:hypothetical protein
MASGAVWRVRNVGSWAAAVHYDDRRQFWVANVYDLRSAREPEIIWGFRSETAAKFGCKIMLSRLIWGTS